jgi:hypothetical protein
MPLKYWDEAFLTTVYLINRLPSKVIQSQTRHERLFGHKGDYSLLRTFGCTCWPNLHPYNKYKLEFRSKQCAFIGYSNMHKGYKCLDISTGHLYISCDIVFDETVFLFASLYSNACTRLRAEINLLPLNLQPFNLHGHEGHDLHKPIDAKPTDVVVVESFVHDLGQNYASGIILMIFFASGMDPGNDSGGSTAAQSFGLEYGRRSVSGSRPRAPGPPAPAPDSPHVVHPDPSFACGPLCGPKGVGLSP